MPSPYGKNYGAKTAPPAPDRRRGPAVQFTSSGQFVERKFPERIPGGGAEGWLMSTFTAAAMAPAKALERPVAGINVVSRAFSNWADFSNKQRSAAEANAPVGPTPKGPVDEVFRRIGQVGIPNPVEAVKWLNPFDAPQTEDDHKLLSIEGLLNGAAVGMQKGGTLVSSVMNAGDANALRYIVENNVSRDTVIPGLHSGINLISNLFDKPLTAGEYLDKLNNRGFFDDYENLDPNTGMPTKLSAVDLVAKMDAAGQFGNFQFGDKDVDENAFINLGAKLATDPTMYLMGAGVPIKVAGWGGQLLRGAGRWTLPRTYGLATGTRGVQRGVGYMDDMARLRIRSLNTTQSTSAAVGNFLNGNVAGTTLRALGWGVKQLYLPGRGSVGLRYARGSTIQQFGLMGIEGGTGFLEDHRIADGLMSPVHDFAEAVLNDHPLAGDQLFVLMSAFNYPVGALAKGAIGKPYALNEAGAIVPGGGVRGAIRRATGENEANSYIRDHEWAEALGIAKPSKFDVNPLGAARRQHAAEAKLYEAFGGKEGFTEFLDHMNLHIGWRALMLNPAMKLHAKSLDHTVGSGGPMADVLRQFVNEQIATGKITPAMRKAEFEKWLTEHNETVVNAEGLIVHTKSDAGFDVPVEGRIESWTSYMQHNRELAERIGPLKDAVLGRSQTMTKEGVRAMQAAVEALAADGVISSRFIRNLLNRYPAMFADTAIPIVTREYFASLMNTGVASGIGRLAGKGKIESETFLEHLSRVEKVTPEGKDLFHEGAAAEAGIIDDIARAGPSPLGPRGVSSLYTQKQLREHRLRSTAEGKALKQEYATAKEAYDAKWTKRGNLKASWVKAEEARLRSQLSFLEAGNSTLRRATKTEHQRIQQELEQLIAMDKGIEWTGAKGGPIAKGEAAANFSQGPRGEATWADWKETATPGARVTHTTTGQEGTVVSQGAKHLTVKWDESGSTGRVVAPAYDLRPAATETALRRFRVKYEASDGSTRTIEVDAVNALDAQRLAETRVWDTVANPRATEIGPAAIPDRPIITKTFNEAREFERLALAEKRGQLSALREDMMALEGRIEELGGVNLHYTMIGRDGRVVVQPEEVTLLQAQTKYTQDAWPGRHEIKRTPSASLPWNAADSAIGAIHVQRTNLGRVLFDYGPVSDLAQMLNYFGEKVSSNARVADAHAMMYSKLMQMGATEADVTKFLADLARRRDDAGTIGPMNINIARYETSLMPGQIEASGASIWGGNSAVMAALKQQYGGSFTKIIDRASNSLVRKGEMAVLKGAGDLSPAAINKALREGSNIDLSGSNLLARIFVSGYHAFQGVPVLASGARMIDKVAYPYFRFYLSPRWQMMNLLENDALGIFQDGLKAGRWNKASSVNDDLVRNAYAQAEARFRDKPVDPRLSGDLPPGRPSAFDLPETGVISGHFLEPVMRNQFGIRAAKDIRKAIDELPAKSPHVKWMEKHFGEERGTWSEKIENMLYRWDKEGVVATAQSEFERISATWSKQEITEFLPFLNRLTEKHAQTYADIAAIQLGNVSRSRLERGLNSYWLYWPISYQIKTTKWMVDLLSNRMFGRQTNLGGAYLLDHAKEIFAEQMRNPHFREQIDEHETLWLALSMLSPAVPWSQGVSLSRIPRYIGGNVLKLWPGYAGMDSPADYARKALEMGPFYDTELVDRGWGELFGEDDTGGTITPPVRTR